MTNGAVRRAKLQSTCHHQQTITQFFYRSDALLVAHVTLNFYSQLFIVKTVDMKSLMLSVTETMHT